MGRDGKGMWMLNMDMEHTHTHNTQRRKRKSLAVALCCALYMLPFPAFLLCSFSRLAIFFREPDSESERKLPSFWQA